MRTSNRTAAAGLLTGAILLATVPRALANDAGVAHHGSTASATASADASAAHFAELLARLSAGASPTAADSAFLQGHVALDLSNAMIVVAAVRGPSLSPARVTQLVTDGLTTSVPAASTPAALAHKAAQQWSGAIGHAPCTAVPPSDADRAYARDWLAVRTPAMTPAGDAAIAPWRTRAAQYTELHAAQCQGQSPTAGHLIFARAPHATVQEWVLVRPN